MVEKKKTSLSIECQLINVEEWIRNLLSSNSDGNNQSRWKSSVGIKSGGQNICIILKHLPTRVLATTEKKVIAWQWRDLADTILTKESQNGISTSGFFTWPTRTQHHFHGVPDKNTSLEPHKETVIPNWMLDQTFSFPFATEHTVGTSDIIEYCLSTRWQHYISVNVPILMTVLWLHIRNPLFSGKTHWNI